MECEECGTPFTSRIGKSVTCSMACYQARYRRVNQKKRAESKRLSYLKNREATRAKAKASRETNGDKLRAYDRTRRPRKVWEPRNCEVCGMEYLPKIDPQKYCSKVCDRRSKSRPSAYKPKQLARVCILCSADFVTAHTRQVYCSVRCRSNASAQRWRAAHPEAVTEGHREWRRKHPDVARRRDQKRRAAERSLPKESFTDTEIFERDGWICQLCRERVDRRYKAPHPKSASLDHVVPLSVEGSPGHTRANSQLAHYGCNSRKKNRKVKGGEQLRLI